MCLVLGLVFGALSVNFYLNGFVMQSFITGALALVLMVFMIRNIRCRQNSCLVKKDSKILDEGPEKEDKDSVDQ